MSEVKTVGYYLEAHREGQGMLPPDSYFTSIDAEEGAALVASDWYTEFEQNFNNLIDLYYYDRVIFNNSRYNGSNDVTNYNNLRHSIAFFIWSKKYIYENLYNVVNAEFNPLWNVDGSVSTVRTLEQTGTDTNARSGHDTNAATGSDVSGDQSTTYDTSFQDTTKNTLTHGRTDTTTFNSSNTETKNLLDTERITVTRQGNIGVTTSTAMLTEAFEFHSKYDLWKYITHDIINQITYGIW